ncbi:MAG: Hsp70 family protein [Bacteroidales bacterium]|nr:Hsp70 family protein [Bacteroidales bacterium]
MRNGILNVSAMDKATGKSQNIRIEASSGLSDDEIKRMKAEAEAHAADDKKAKEEIEKINAAWQAASQEMYQAQQQAGPQGAAGFDPNNMGGAGFQGGNPGANNQGPKSGNDTVEDADYEEVK